MVTMEMQDESYINTVFCWGILIAVIGCFLLPVSLAGFAVVFLGAGLLLARRIKKEKEQVQH